jgi:hypothetical protein
MKTLKTLIAALLISASAFAQNVGINADGSSPDASAMLDVKSTTKGFLAPRVSSTGDITSPATGLLVYQTGGTPGYYYYNGSAWTQLGTASGASQWTTTGSDIYFNTGNVGIGTTTPQSLTHLYTSANKEIPALGSVGGHQIIQTGAVLATCIGVNGNGNYWIQPQRINDGGSQAYSILLCPSGGNVGIGTTEPTAKLQINDGNVANGTNTQFAIYGGRTNTTNVEYANIFFGERSDGGGAGSKISAYTGNSNYQTGLAFSTSKDIGGSSGLTEAMRIAPSGNVGIGTTTSLSKLQVYGTETGANWAGRGAFGGASSAVVLGQYNNKAYFGAHNAALDTWTDLAINPGGGNVGIGTTTPSVTLDVNGSFKASGMPTIICPITTVAAGNDFPFGTAETLTGNISSDASSITIGETGLYLISFALGFGNSSHGWITVNGAGRLVSWTNSDPDIFTTTTVAPLNSGDVIRLYLYSGTFSTDANRKFICVTKLH